MKLVWRGVRLGWLVLWGAAAVVFILLSYLCLIIAGGNEHAD